VAGKLFILSAPSGSGKSTLVKRLRAQVANLDFSISYTTRAKRGQEMEGREYHFVTRQQFDGMIADHAFVEHAEVFGNCYGTAWASLEHADEAARDLILDIDIQGAAQVMQRFPKSVSIFILPPSPDVLARRLRDRSVVEHVTSQEIIATRLSAANREVGQWRIYRYALVNDQLEDAIEQLKAIVEFERGAASDQATRTAQDCLTSRPSPRLLDALRAFHLPTA
jgi:guanylate kinase